MAFSYSTSGWTKLLANGWGWANGAALQLWVWGADPAVPHLRELILEHRGLAAALQGAVLLAEAGALLALTHRFVRLGVGLVLLGFHVTGELIFGYGFYGNIAALLCVFLLPPKFPALASSSPGASA